MAGYQAFSLRNLYKITPLAEAFDDLLRSLARDCIDRPGETKNRELTIKLKITPDASDPDNVIVEPVIGNKMPSRRIDRYRMTTAADGEIRFQPNFPLDPHQQDLLGDDDDE
jgi:hypothetical protein